MQRRVTTTSQPQHAAQVDWGNPICRGLVSLVTGVERIDLARNNRPSAQSGPYTKTVSRFGVGRSFQRANAAVDSYPASGFSGDATMILVGGLSQPLAGTQVLLGLESSGGVVRFVLLESSNNNLSFQTQPVGGSAVLAAAGGIGNFVYVARLSGTEMSLWRNGARVSTATQAGADFSDITKFSVGFTGFLSNPSGEVFLAGYYRRALSDAEIQSISANPWQIFTSHRGAPYLTATVAFDGKYRPTSDISDGTWTRTPAGPDLYSAIDEPVADDADYITSPISGSTPATMAIGPIPSGSQTLRIRAGTSSGTATLTVELLNDSNTVLATQTQALTSTTTTYNLTFSLASTATRVRIGVA